jgi:acetoacetate decarboxylase
MQKLLPIAITIGPAWSSHAATQHHYVCRLTEIPVLEIVVAEYI